MYGLIGKMLAVGGKRQELLDVMLAGMIEMPGCVSYVIALDPTSDDALWISEVWESQELHRASLQLKGVRATIAQARPLIAGFGERFETVPVGGTGIGPRPGSR